MLAGQLFPSTELAGWIARPLWQLPQTTTKRKAMQGTIAAVWLGWHLTLCALLNPQGLQGEWWGPLVWWQFAFILCRLFPPQFIAVRHSLVTSSASDDIPSRSCALRLPVLLSWLWLSCSPCNRLTCMPQFTLFRIYVQVRQQQRFVWPRFLFPCKRQSLLYVNSRLIIYWPVWNSPFP